MMSNEREKKVRVTSLLGTTKTLTSSSLRASDGVGRVSQSATSAVSNLGWTDDDNVVFHICSSKTVGVD